MLMAIKNKIFASVHDLPFLLYAVTHCRQDAQRIYTSLATTKDLPVYTGKYNSYPLMGNLMGLQ